MADTPGAGGKTRVVSPQEMIRQVNAACAVGDLATHLANALGGDPDFYARQIRRWAQLGFIQASDVRGSGRRAARLFEREAIFPARLLSWCTALGLTNSDMELAINTLDKPDHSGSSPLERYLRGEKLYLVMAINHEGEVTCVTAETGDNITSTSEDAPATITISLAALFAPLVTEG